MRMSPPVFAMIGSLLRSEELLNTGEPQKTCRSKGGALALPLRTCSVLVLLFLSLSRGRLRAGKRLQVNGDSAGIVGVHAKGRHGRPGFITVRVDPRPVAA